MTFRSMGSDIRLIIEPALAPGLPAPDVAAEAEQLYVEDFARRLSRFREDSELCELNRAPGTEVPASPLLRAAVAAGLWAAERSGGLVDPTLVGEIEAIGYAHSMDGCRPASLQEALAAAPAPRAARPREAARWRDVHVDDARGTVTRPPGVRIDTGGIGKGLAADAVAHRLGGYRRYVVDCGGDITIGGVGAQLEPIGVEVEHPVSGECVQIVQMTAGGIATSGMNVRIWQQPDGSFAHHLLDPSTGEPVWSGLIGATAVAPSALEAETLSKLALLGGPAGARRALSEHGGLVVHNDGDVELIGPLASGRAAAQLARVA
jgi:thiamine biosynthesis lipoprotein